MFIFYKRLDHIKLNEESVSILLMGLYLLIYLIICLLCTPRNRRKHMSTAYVLYVMAVTDNKADRDKDKRDRSLQTLLQCAYCLNQTTVEVFVNFVQVPRPHLHHPITPL